MDTTFRTCLRVCFDVHPLETPLVTKCFLSSCTARLVRSHLLLSCCLHGAPLGKALATPAVAGMSFRVVVPWWDREMVGGLASPRVEACTSAVAKDGLGWWLSSSALATFGGDPAWPGHRRSGHRVSSQWRQVLGCLSLSFV